MLPTDPELLRHLVEARHEERLRKGTRVAPGAGRRAALMGWMTLRRSLGLTLMRIGRRIAGARYERVSAS